MIAVRVRRGPGVLSVVTVVIMIVARVAVQGYAGLTITRWAVFGLTISVPLRVHADAT